MSRRRAMIECVPHRGFVAALVLVVAGAVACSKDNSGQPSTVQDDARSAVTAVPASGSDEAAGNAMPPIPTTDEMLPTQFSVVWEPWLGDYEGMVERRVIRVLVPYGGYQYFYDNGEPRGAVYELLQHFERWVNEQLERRHVRVYVVVIPVSRNELLPALEAGHADLVAGDLTVTADRSEAFRFSRPLLRNVDEVVVTGPVAPELESIDSLAGQEVYVRRSSSYYEHLTDLVEDFRARGLEPPVLMPVEELLEAEDILELVDAGVIGITVLDDYKADFWAELFPHVAVRHDLVVNQGGRIAWASRKDSPEFGKVVDSFLRKYGRGTLVGNDTFNRYLADAEHLRCMNSGQEQEALEEMAGVFTKYADQYDFHWLMLAAQAFQESGLQQDRRSPAGAVGIMQIKPSTAADPNVGIHDVSLLENNVHAGAKYLRFLADRYFSDGDVSPLNQWLLSLAAYNAGPARVASLRREAASSGYDPDHWFDQVEIIAARRIGRETVTYVSNIFKYYVGYQIVAARRSLRSERYGEVLTGCES